MAKCLVCGTTIPKGATLCPRCGCNVFSTSNKYHNEKVKTKDGTFDSKFEYERWCYLKMLERAKLITDLKRQVPYELIPKSEYGRAIKYVADFVYTDKNGKQIVEDTKSEITKTRVYALKKRLLAEKFHITITEITKKDLR